MAWLRIDTGFPRHRKLGRLKPGERWQHLEAMCWCAEMGTDGRIDVPDLAVIWPGMSRPAARRLAELLAEAGLWDERKGGGWEIHDWRVYNLAADRAKEMRDREAERKRQWRERKRTGDVPASVTPDVPPDVPRRVRRDKTRDETRDETRTSSSRGRPDPTKGRGSPPTPPPVVESAAAPPEPEPGAQSPPPEVNGTGEPRRVDLDAVEAAMPESVRGAVRRARRQARSGGGG